MKKNIIVLFSDGATLFSLLKEGSEEFNQTFNVIGAITNNIEAPGKTYLEKNGIPCIDLQENQNVYDCIKNHPGFAGSNAIMLSHWRGILSEELKTKYAGGIYLHTLGW